MKTPDPIEAGLTDITKGSTKLIFAAAGVAGAAGAIWATEDLTIRPDLDQVIADIFFQYASLALAIERAAAVFVAMTRDRLRVDWVLRIDRVEQVLTQDQPRLRVLKQIHDREQNRIATLTAAGRMTKITPVKDKLDDKDNCIEEYIGYLTAVKHAYEFQQARFQSVSRRYTSVGVFFAGIILAALGLSLFGSIFADVEKIPGVQRLLLHYMDIVITGGFLGGGSTGINTIATKLTERNSKA